MVENILSISANLRRNDMKKIAIVGSRNFNDFDLMNRVVFQDYIEKNGLYAEDVMIISGGANGADKLAEKLAQLRGYKLVVFKADWNKYGKKAGIIRNQYIVESADVVFAFWNKKSSGTANSIQRAINLGKELYVKEF